MENNPNDKNQFYKHNDNQIDSKSKRKNDNVTPSNTDPNGKNFIDVDENNEIMNYENKKGHNEKFQIKNTQIKDDYSNVLMNYFPQSPTYTGNSVKSKYDTYNQTQGTNATFFSKNNDLEMESPEFQQKILDNIQNK